MFPRMHSRSIRWLVGFYLVLCGAQTSSLAYAAGSSLPNAASENANTAAATINEVRPRTTATSTTSPPTTVSNVARPAQTAANPTPISALKQEAQRADAPTSIATVAEREAQAEREFQAGLELMRGDRCREAIKHFAVSQELDSSAAALVNTAICYERIGKTAAAWRTFVEAVNASVLEGSSELRNQADAALRKLGPILTRVRVVTAPSERSHRVWINGEPVRDYSEPIPVDPGETVIEVTAPGRRRWRVTVLAKGMGSVLVVEVPELTPAIRVEPKPSRKADLRPAAMIVGGAGIASLFVAGAAAIGANSANDSANSQGLCDGSSCNQKGHDLRDKAWSRAREWLPGRPQLARPP